MGARMSRDFTRGYGPETFDLKKAHPGIYKIKTHYYSNSQQSLSGATTLLCSVFTNYARPTEIKQQITVRLQKSNSDILIGEIEIKQ